MEQLPAILYATVGSPQWQLVGLAIVGTAALQVLVAVWAAASRRHWFLRAIVLWAAVGALVPIRAYEPALLFAISSPLTVAAICGWLAIASRIAASSPTADSDSLPVSMRFGIRDLLLVAVIVGLSLVVLIEVVRNLPQIDASGLAAYVVALVGLGVASYGVVFGQRYRYWTFAGALGAIAAAVYLLVGPTADWIRLGNHFGNFDSSLYISEERAPLVLCLIAQYILAFCLALLLFRLGSASERSVRRVLARLSLAAVGVSCLSIGALIYWHMLWLTPLPAPVAAEPNHYRRILAIAHEIAASKLEEQSLTELRAAIPRSEVPDRLELLYAELLPLLDAPNAIVLPPPIRDKDGTAGLSPTIDSIQVVRSLARRLDAEAKYSASHGELDRAVTWSLANVRLGTMFSRGGTMIEYLIGMAIESVGTSQLAAERARFQPAHARRVIAALDRARAEHDAPDTIRDRDDGYMERWEGWTVRLEHVLAELQGTRTGSEYTSAAMRRLMLHRLLQTDLAVRVFRHEQGRWPPSLNDLVPDYLPAIPLDSYSGQPLRYRTADDAFILYSVGQDKTDNGGRFGNTFQYYNNDGFDLDLDLWSRPW